ncbi:unnamed protein product [Phytomonas sp. Hart1]|nr:unnamed protein product [Phytomonas sp. Hart1]|eukprot:CCW66894.1 unnamed protein product [Phytomonas sp. isolate Hart1]
MDTNNLLVTESLVLLFLYSFRESCPNQRDASSAQRARLTKPEKKNSSGFPYTENQLRIFARILCLINSILLLKNGVGAREVTCTERDLYYCNPPLFAPQGQGSVHRCLERLGVWMRIAASCMEKSDGLPQPHQGAAYQFIFTTPQTALERIIATDGHKQPYSREDLGVVATPKSILVGPLSMMLCYPQGGAADSAPVQVGCHGIHLTAEMALYGRGYSVGDGSREVALVFVEKESTLRTLLGEIQEPLPSPSDGGGQGGCVRRGRSYRMLCTKGYPCVASRLFVRRLNAEHPQLPLLALVDGDPHGLRILLTMLEGSPTCRSLTRNSAGSRHRIASSSEADYTTGLLPLQWVGLRPSRMSPPHLSNASLMPLSASDGIVLRQLERRISGHLAGDRSIHPCARTTLSHMLEEVQWMWRTRLKGELQACTDGPLSLLEEFPLHIYL